jgi:hypothetical protein
LSVGTGTKGTRAENSPIFFQSSAYFLRSVLNPESKLG